MCSCSKHITSIFAPSISDNPSGHFEMIAQTSNPFFSFLQNPPPNAYGDYSGLLPPPSLLSPFSDALSSQQLRPFQLRQFNSIFDLVGTNSYPSSIQSPVVDEFNQDQVQLEEQMEEQCSYDGESAGDATPDPPTVTELKPPKCSSVPRMVNVWNENLEDSFKHMRSMINNHYNFVAMDTEFPGVLIWPSKEDSKMNPSYQYEVTRLNTSELKLIQLGLTFYNSKGELPLAPWPTTWQFNFHFDLEQDLYADNSIELLKQNDIKFERHAKEGIDTNDFAELLITSGLVLNDDVQWICFHGCYDYGYMVRLLLGQNLPDTEPEFFNLLNQFFPRLFDVKCMVKTLRSPDLWGGLWDLAHKFGVDLFNVGPRHQAGPGSYAAGECFFRLRRPEIRELVATLASGIGLAGKIRIDPNAQLASTLKPDSKFDDMHETVQGQVFGFKEFTGDQFMPPYQQIKTKMSKRDLLDPLLALVTVEEPVNCLSDDGDEIMQIPDYISLTEETSDLDEDVQPANDGIESNINPIIIIETLPIVEPTVASMLCGLDEDTVSIIESESLSEASEIRSADFETFFNESHSLDDISFLD